MTHPAAPWFDYFEVAYLINLDSAPERLSKASERLHAAGIPFERFAAFTGPEGSSSSWDKIGFREHAACARSHRAVIQKAYNLGHKRVLIFEDDVVFRNDVHKHMPKIILQLSEMDWDIFYMGLYLRNGQRFSRSLGRVWDGWHAHAYSVSRKAMPRIISYIDAYLSNCQKTYFDGLKDPALKKYYACPTLAIQDSNYSTTDHRFIFRYLEQLKGLDLCSFFWHCDEVTSLLPASSRFRRLGNAPLTFFLRFYVILESVYLAIKFSFKKLDARRRNSRKDPAR